jgi:integrase
MLAQELVRLRAERDDPPPGEHVFLSWHGTAYHEVRKVWVLTLKAAGLGDREGMGFHCLRHSHATHFLENGGSVTDLMQQLGHANLETTQRYAAALSERRRETVMAMDFPAPSAAKGRRKPHVTRGRERRSA